MLEIYNRNTVGENCHYVGVYTGCHCKHSMSLSSSQLLHRMTN